MALSSFSIKSSSSDRELVFSEPRKDYFTVELRGNEPRAIRKVYAYSPHSPNIAAFFGRLASYDGPWESVECWESLEGEFALSATCSVLGVITFTLSMHGRLDSQDKWRISTTIIVEFGQLPGIASSAEQFFSVVAGT
jgi:hypothetical protein